MAVRGTAGVACVPQSGAEGDPTAARESYGKALARHHEKLGKDSEKVEKWRQPLFEAPDFTGTDAVKGIVLDLPTREELDINLNAFTHMRKLTLLLVLNAQISRGPICLPNDLRWLEWPEYPLATLKFSAGPKKLVWFDVHNSQIKGLGDNLKVFEVSEATLRRCWFHLIGKQAENDLRVPCQHELPLGSAFSFKDNLNYWRYS